LVNLEHIQMMKRAIFDIWACLQWSVQTTFNPISMGGGKPFSNNLLRIKGIEHYK